MNMLQAIIDIPAEDIRRGISRISPDHPLARSHAEAFRPADDSPPAGVRTRDLREMAERVRQDHERRVISNRVAEIEAEDRQRESSENAYERPETRRERIFWEQSERLLASQREPESPTPGLYQIDYLLSEEERAELERIDQLWEGRAPWHQG